VDSLQKNNPTWSSVHVNVSMTFLLLPGVCVPAEPSAPLSEPSSEDTLLLVWFHKGGKPPDCWHSFGISGCTITIDRRLYSQAHAVLIAHRDVINIGDWSLPQESRPPGQKWIWFNVYAPSNSLRLWEYEGLYNLTLTYREDSDIALPVGYVIPNAFLDDFPMASFAYRLDTSSTSSPRPGFVSWVVSHWGENLERVSLYKHLKEYIQIDVFGGVGTPIPPGKETVVELIRQYRFYLAFENSQYTDYITEKLWNAVQGGAIPVVLGPSRKNYERFLPPEAFIHVDDFPTVWDLARYLLVVKDSPSLIELHLSWRRDYSMYRPYEWREFHCTACRVVRERKGRTDVVQHLAAWFYS
uniref:Fucosyltransferase n=1 Tax=Salarias fasciatus TaxID=181472 RepID=A0A672JNP9_SALFA